MSESCPLCGGDLPGNLVTVDIQGNHLVAGGVSVRLTPREAEVAYMLWKARPRILSVEFLADEIFKNSADGMSTLGSLIFRLRRKIVENGMPVFIGCVRSRGYQWVDFTQNHNQDGNN